MIVTCLNNKNKPNEVPNSIWEKLIEGEEYTVIEIAKLHASGGIYGFKLAEIDLSPCAPYLYFASYRFGIKVPADIIKEEELELEEVIA